MSVPRDDQERAALLAKARDIGARIKALREAHPDEAHHAVLFKMSAIAGEIEALLSSEEERPT